MKTTLYTLTALLIATPSLAAVVSIPLDLDPARRPSGLSIDGQRVFVSTSDTNADNVYEFDRQGGLVASWRPQAAPTGATIQGLSMDNGEGLASITRPTGPGTWSRQITRFDYTGAAPFQPAFYDVPGLVGGIAGLAHDDETGQAYVAHGQWNNAVGSILSTLDPSSDTWAAPAPVDTTWRPSDFFVLDIAWNSDDGVLVSTRPSILDPIIDLWDPAWAHAAAYDLADITDYPHAIDYHDGTYWTIDRDQDQTRLVSFTLSDVPRVMIPETSTAVLALLGAMTVLAARRALR